MIFDTFLTLNIDPGTSLVQDQADRSQKPNAVELDRR